MLPDLEYAGMCIGGPHAGRKVAMRGPVYKVAEMPQPQFTYFDAPSDGPVGPTTVAAATYVHHLVAGIPCWVPEDMTREQAVRLLLKNYEERHHG